MAVRSYWCRRQPPGDPYNSRADRRTRREAIMDVYEAVRTRRSVRNFTNRPVPREALERVLSAAAWAPSGSNIQPWHIYVVTGASLAELRKLAGERVAAGDRWDEREYEIYPAALTSPYRERKSAFGAQRYGALGIARGTWRRASGPLPRTGTSSARPPPCSATSTGGWARPNGPTSAC